MTRRQYIAFGAFMIALCIMIWGVPALAEKYSSLLPGVALSTVCLLVMMACIIKGNLSNITPDEECENKEDENMNIVSSTLNAMNDETPFLSFGIEELDICYKEIARLANASLAIVAEGDDREKPREKALFKLAGVLKGQIEIRRDAEARLMDAAKAVEDDEG